MKQIKFWDPAAKKMRGPFNFEETTALRSMVPRLGSGLMDKNGNEIFEGDLLKSDDRCVESVNKDCLSKVAFSHGAFWTMCEHSGFMLSMLSSAFMTDKLLDFEIMGNIHEEVK